MSIKRSYAKSIRIYIFKLFKRLELVFFIQIAFQLEFRSNHLSGLINHYNHFYFTDVNNSV